MINMSFPVKRTSFLVLGILSLACSRMVFFFFSDPEGPNMLVIIGLALILFFLSLTVYLFRSSVTARNKLLLAVFIQMIVAVAFYLWLM